MIVFYQDIVIYKTFYLDVARGRVNGALNETWTLSWRFDSVACKLLHHITGFY